MYSSKVLKATSRKNIKWRKIIFYACLMAIPVLQISLFYVYVNASSFAMAFRSYYYNDNFDLAYSYSWENIKNFKDGWEMMIHDSENARIKNTFIYFLTGLLINVPLALVSSYYVYKKKHASGFFKVMLFMPQVLSSVVLAFIYKELLERGYLFLTNQMGQDGLLMSHDTAVFWVIIFNLIMSFGANVLIYSSSMSSINESIIESSQIDGCNSFRQFISIILPMIYPTIVSLLVVFIAAFFTNQYYIYTLFAGGQGSPVTTNIGHFLYCQNYESTYIGSKEGFLDYPALSALGLTLTAIILPLTLIARWALNKFGPRAD